MRGVYSLPNPTVDIRRPIPDVLADPKAHGPLAPVAPRIESPNRQIEEIGELFDGEETIVVVHPTIIEDNPVARVPPDSA